MGASSDGQGLEELYRAVEETPTCTPSRSTTTTTIATFGASVRKQAQLLLLLGAKEVEEEEG